MNPKLKLFISFLISVVLFVESFLKVKFIYCWNDVSLYALPAHVSVSSPPPPIPIASPPPAPTPVPCNQTQSLPVQLLNLSMLK